MARPKNRGLLYARRSTDKQEISLPNQVEWAIATARQHDVALDATVAELCHNQIIVGLHEYGKRSEGQIRRLGAQGPRLLEEEKDLSGDGRPRVITNDPSLRISKQVGETKYDMEQWRDIQTQMQERGRTQRGIARAKDPARYPLACRLVDLTGGCGSVL